jgi:DNA polymerase III alpha subunit
MSVEQLVQKAAEHNAEAIALTDINNSTGMPEFITGCISRGIKPLTGIEFRNGNELLYIGVARNNDGIRELNEFLSVCNISSESPGFPPPRFSNSYIIYRYDKLPGRKLYENELTGIRPSEVNSMLTNSSRICIDKAVILCPVTVSCNDELFIHKSLRAVDNNILLSHLKQWQCAADDEFFQEKGWLEKAFSQYPRVIGNTSRLIDDCNLSVDLKSPKNKQLYSASRYDDKLLLEKLAWDGMLYRYGKNSSEAKRRIRHELDIIDKLGFSAYFLITWDIVRYSMSRGFYHVGRGSGANSIVAYCLKITNVDPIDLNLYFERFINPKRSSPPDFDIDYSWKERDEVLDYIFKRYGHNHTALLGLQGQIDS